MGSRGQSVVVTVPEIFRDRSFRELGNDGAGFGGSRLGKISPAVHPSPMRLGRHGPAWLSMEIGSQRPLSRCAPQPQAGRLAVPLTNTSLRRYVSSEPVSNALMPVGHEQTAVTIRSGEGLSAPEALSHGPLARFGTIFSWCLSGELAELLRCVRLVPPPDSLSDVTH